ncbi:hypothetical protein B0H19DRAFT_1145069 [Mycena capillaripes]|nr:hypothetical protein B0H19DRAFT_1145069 [Mycena capillaripes]
MIIPKYAAGDGAGEFPRSIKGRTEILENQALKLLFNQRTLWQCSLSKPSSPWLSLRRQRFSRFMRSASGMPDISGRSMLPRGISWEPSASVSAELESSRSTRAATRPTTCLLLPSATLATMADLSSFSEKSNQYRLTSPDVHRLSRIVGPVDPAANYVSLVAGVTDCPSAAFMGPAPWAAIAAADGFPHGPFTTPGPTRTTLQGNYGNLKTFCGECMTFALGNAVGRQVLLPQWRDPNSNVWANLPVVQDSTFVRLLATPNVQAHSKAFSNAVVQQVYLSVFLR